MSVIHLVAGLAITRDTDILYICTGLSNCIKAKLFFLYRFVAFESAVLFSYISVSPNSFFFSRTTYVRMLTALC